MLVKLNRSKLLKLIKEENKHNPYLKNKKKKKKKT